jgi:hypothetical protein
MEAPPQLANCRVVVRGVVLSDLHNCQQSRRSQSKTRHSIPCQRCKQVPGAKPFCRIHNQCLRRKHCPEAEDETIDMEDGHGEQQHLGGNHFQRGGRGDDVALRQFDRFCEARGAGGVQYHRRVRLVDHNILPGDHSAIVAGLLQEREESRGVEDNGFETGRELGGGVLDCEGEGGIGERNEGRDLPGGEGGIGGGHDGADGHDRVVEHGDVDTGGRENEGDVARGDTQLDAESGGERVDPGEESGKRDGLAGGGIDEGRVGGELGREEGEGECQEGDWALGRWQWDRQAEVVEGPCGCGKRERSRTDGPIDAQLAPARRGWILTSKRAVESKPFTANPTI